MSRRVALGLAVGVLVAGVLVLGGVGPTGAQTGAAEPEGWAYELANYLMSPFCPGKTLADCPSPNAASLRMWLVVQEAAGRERSDVEEELYERYGEIMRPAPKAEGFGLTAYVFPVVAFLGGGVGIGFYLHRQTRKRPVPQAVATAPAASDPELERLIDEELARGSAP